MANEIRMADTRLTEPEIEAAIDVLRSGALRQGPKVAAFESDFAKWVGADDAIAVANGSASLHLAYLALLEPGDEVLVPSFTFIATASMVSFAGGTPVFCDVDPNTFLIDLDDAESRITSRTRAIAPVHLFGNSCDINAVREFADRHGLKIIWDAAQAHGATFQGEDIGSAPDVVSYSLYPTKNLFVGEGGMITLQDAELGESLRLLRSHGVRGKYNHVVLGLNYRMSDVEAAIGLAQLKRLDSMLKQRRINGATLSEAIEELPGIEAQAWTPDSNHAMHQYCITVDPSIVGVDRDTLAERLQALGIETGVHYPRGLHQQPAYVELQGRSSLPVTERLSETILALPVHHGLGASEMSRVAESLRESATS